MKVFLKSTITSEAELTFIAAQYLELDHLIDRFIIVEPDFTHTGRSRNRVGVEKLLKAIPFIAKKLDYLPLPMTRDVLTNVESVEVDCHINERLTRGMFTRFIDLSPRDIVISTDADEVLYAGVVEKAIDRLSSRLIAWQALSLQLHQFTYRDTLIAPGFRFSGPSIIGCGRYILTRRPMQWRYAGRLMPEIAGCHFSWCQPIPDLVRKVSTFAHAPSYNDHEQSPRERIENDIRNLCYSFRTPSLALTELKNPDEYWPKGYIMARKLGLGGENA